MTTRQLQHIMLVFSVGLVSGCTGEQSVFAGASPYSEKIIWLTNLMVVVAILITLLVVVLTTISLFSKGPWKKFIANENIVWWGGIVFPVVVLSALLIYGFMLLSDAEHGENESDALHISVVGEQWWWRFIYSRADGSSFETANEMRIPVKTPVFLHLTTADVIHSFWIPAYAGKLDMIPGRENVMKIKVQKAGTYRGQCAEYCGGAHALMSMYSVAMPPTEFEVWMEAESRDAYPQADKKGRALFIANGCGACHTIRGTRASGKIGPDLTHVGSRISIGAGTLRTSEDNFEAWIANHHEIKPDNLMPRFDYLSASELKSLAKFLIELK